MATLAALAIGSATGTGASFTDAARAVLGVQAADTFPCPSTVSTPYTFTQAPAGTWWTAQSALCSPNRAWIAVFQADGNFVLYDTTTIVPTSKWATWTWGTDRAGLGKTLAFQGDGNLVIYDAAGAALRNTFTGGIGLPATLSLGDDGILTVRDATGVVRYSSAGAELEDCRFAGFACRPHQEAAA